MVRCFCYAGRAGASGNRVRGVGGRPEGQEATGMGEDTVRGLLEGVKLIESQQIIPCASIPNDEEEQSTNTDHAP